MGNLEPLYEIAAELMTVIEAEEFNENALDELVMKFEIKAAGLAHFIGLANDFADMAEKEAKRIRDRATSAKNRANRLMEYLQNSMEKTGIMELEIGTKKLKLDKKPASLIIDKPEKVPAKYQTVEVVTKIDKMAIKKIIKDGGKVTGCHLEAGLVLRIK